MLVFIDESGDTGRKIDSGSSRYFVVSLVLFEQRDEAERCDGRIELLKRELGYTGKYEFHYQTNSLRVRDAFLSATAAYNFTYFAVVIDKDPKKLFGPGFEIKESFYKFACNMVFTHAKPHLKSVIVVIDKSGSPGFQTSLKKYISKVVNPPNGNKIIKRLKQQPSHSNNLLQLADYVSGVLHRKYQNKKEWRKHYEYIVSKEAFVQQWPK